MAEKDAPSPMRLVSEELDALFREVSGALDTKALSLIESRARAVTAVIRAYGMMIDVLRKEDNMSMNENGGDEGALERANQVRADIERRLARLRAHLEGKSLADEAERDAD